MLDKDEFLFIKDLITTVEDRKKKDNDRRRQNKERIDLIYFIDKNLLRWSIIIKSIQKT